jgi:hypothetical protein
VDENSTTPFDICNQTLERCKPVEESKHIYECVCKYSDINCNCIDVETNNKYCGNDKDNCEEIIGEAVCKKGRCQCNNGNASIYTNIDGERICAEVDNDTNCCGEECNKCDANLVCDDGMCKNQCETSKTINCNGHCLDKDVYHVKLNEDGECVCEDYYDKELKEDRTACPDIKDDIGFGCRYAYEGDKNNCGACGIVCREDQTCVSNKICKCSSKSYECKFSAGEYNGNTEELVICLEKASFAALHIQNEESCKLCEENYANLDGDWSNGCEVDLKTTMKHCGAANHDCHVQINQAYEVSCQEGKCEFQGCADTNFMDCNDDSTRDDPDGCETNILTSAAHCGKCGHACTEGAICHEGACCYQAYNDIQADIAQFQCCEGYHLYEYKPSFAFPFCWGAARYACAATDMSASDGCWVAVE